MAACAVAATDLDLVLPPREATRLARLPVLAAHRIGRAHSVAVAIVWHDTAEGALAAAGRTLCERRIGRRRHWRLACLHAALPGSRARVLAEGGDPAALGHKLPTGLLAVAACEGRKRHWALNPDSAGATALSVLDGQLRAVADAHPICRVRLHGVTDPALAIALAGAVGLAVSTAPLAVAALALAGRTVPPAAPPALTPEHSVSAAFATVLAQQGSVLLRLAPRAAAGDGTEPVHQMRVALRRLRSARALFRHAVDGPALAALQPELQELAQRLGPARDWDVFVTGTARAVVDAFPEDRAVARLRDAALRRRAASYAALAAWLHGAAFRTLGIRLGWLAAVRPWEEAALSADAPAAAALAQPLPAFAAHALMRRRKQVLAPQADAAGLSAAALHALRIQSKRLRYTAELFAPLYPPRPVHRLLRRVSRLQERLGQLNDATVATSLLATLGAAGRGYAAGVVRGFIAATHRDAHARALRAWRRVRRVAPFWGDRSGHGGGLFPVGRNVG